MHELMFQADVKAVMYELMFQADVKAVMYELMFQADVKGMSELIPLYAHARVNTSH